MKKALVLLSFLLFFSIFSGCLPNNPSKYTEGSTEAVGSTAEEPGALEQEAQYEAQDTKSPSAPLDSSKEEKIDENGSFYTRDQVALYIKTYGRLPKNYITKSEAKKLGWKGGSVEKYAPGCAIGGDKFGNFEDLLPTGDGITYKECDIDTIGKNERGAKRIVFSSDLRIYYTDDHYETFTELLTEE